MFVREFEFSFTAKLWDIFLAIGNESPLLVLYISASLLDLFTDKILSMRDISELADFIQKLPTKGWGDAELIRLVNGAIDILGQDSERKFKEVLAARALNAKGADTARSDRTKKLVTIGITALAAACVAYFVYNHLNARK